MENEKIKILLKELDKFIYKYHLIKFLQSTLIAIALIILTFLILITIGYYTYPNPQWKKIILLFYLVILLWILIEYVFFKAIPLWNKNKRISYRQAAILIIKLNPEFNDKLLSLLDFANVNEDNPLIQASINEKISSLKIWDIKNILTYKEAKKSLRVLGISLFFLVFIFIIKTDLILTGTEKIINYNKYYIKPAPFKFILLNKNLKVLQDSDFIISLKVKGKIIPENVFININGNTYLMPRQGNSLDQFFYKIKSVEQDIKFFFSAQGYKSSVYQLRVIAMPYIKNSTVVVIPPQYTGLKKQIYQNITELTIPSFSKLIIKFNLKNTDSVKLISGIDTITREVKTNHCQFQRYIINNQILKFILYHNGSDKEAIQIKIKTNLDQAPYIRVEELIDSQNYNIHYFMVKIKDDYGFSLLKFFIKTQDTILNYILPINQSNEQFLQYGYNFDSISKIYPDINYYFLICDNRSPKPNCTKSNIFHFEKPSHQEIANQIDSLDQEIEKKAELAKNLTKDLHNLTQDYQQKLLTEKLNTWEKQEYSRRLNDKINELESVIKELQNLNQQKQSLLNSFSSIPEPLKQKQDLINDMLNQLLNEDLKNLLKQLNEILNKSQPNNPQSDLEYNSFNRKLNQTLNFLKRLAIEQKALEQTKALEELAQQQDSLKKNLHQKQVSKEKAIKKQEEIRKKLQAQEQKYNQLRKENSLLNNPMKLKDFSPQFNNVQQMMQQNTNYINQNKIRKSLKLQEKIIDSLENISKQMSQQFNSAQMQTNSIELEKLVKSIYRLEDLSINIENLINLTQSLNYTNQSLDKLSLNIKELEQEYKPIADSLFSLGEKNIQIAKLIDSHLYSIEKSFQDIYKFVEKRKRQNIYSAQYNILDNTNTILLIITDIAQNINKQQNNAIPNMNPKQKQQGSNMQQLSQLQQMLEKQLQNLIEQAKKGKISSKEIAKALVLKEKINFEVEKLLNQYSNSIEVAQKLKEVKRLNHMIDKQLTDKQLDNSLLQKAKFLKVKLLEAENSIRTQNKKSNQRIAQHKFDKFRTPQLTIEQNQMEEKQYITKQSLQNKIIQLNSFYYKIYQSYINK